jgi:hypothetical protein
MIRYNKLPENFKNFARKKILKRVIPCAVLLCGLALLLAFFGKEMFPTDIAIARYSFYLIGMLIPFAVTGVPFKLIDHSYCGTVEKVSIKTTTDNHTPMKPTRENSYSKNTIYLSVRLKDGSCIRRKAYEGPAKLQQHLNTYSVGDFVFHLYGSSYTVVIPANPTQQAQCPICGEYNDPSADTCRSCNGLLIQKEELEALCE